MAPIYNKIYAIGDSHAGTFYSIAHVAATGPNTMHMIGIKENNLIEDHIKMGAIKTDGLLIFCFGEIDVRCHIHNQIIEKNRLEDEVIETLAINYINKIKTVQSDVGIMSVIPPAQNENGNNVNVNLQYPFIGSDVDRVRYTRKLNFILKNLCKQNNILYFDVYNLYCDENGHLSPTYADFDKIHIQDRSAVSKVLVMLDGVEEVQKYKI